MQAKKSLGQNFLKDKFILSKIADAVKEEKEILEIGAGFGALTEYLLKFDANITAVELDMNLVEMLKEKFDKKINIVHEDARYYRLEKYCVVIGNLPYSAAKKIIYNLVEQRHLISKMIFMLQREVADNILAKHGFKEYSKFTIFVQLFFKARRLFNVPKEAFIPKPKVESTVLEFIPYMNNLLKVNVDKSFFDFLDILFAHPRKTVKNNLRYLSGLNSNVLHLRPKDLSIYDIYKIYRGAKNE